MPARSKRYLEAMKEFDKNKLHTVDEAIEVVKAITKSKYDSTLEVHVKLGVDPRRSEQNVRGTVVLPHGTGKTPKVIVFTKGDMIDKALAAGADEAGAEELVEKVKNGWMDWDIAAATPDAMGIVGKVLGRVLGPKMPSPKSGTVTQDVVTMVKELKSGKVQFRTDKMGIIHSPLGKVSFENDKVKENFKVLIDALLKAKPTTAKGTYLKSVVLCSTQSPGVRLDPNQVALSLKDK